MVLEDVCRVPCGELDPGLCTLMLLGIHSVNTNLVGSMNEQAVDEKG